MFTRIIDAFQYRISIMSNTSIFISIFVLCFILFAILIPSIFDAIKDYFYDKWDYEARRSTGMFFNRKDGSIEK